MELHHPPELKSLHAGAETPALRVLETAPPIQRRSMAPRAWSRRVDPATSAAVPGPYGRWYRAAVVRRSVLLLLIVAQTWIATGFMAGVMPYQGRQILEIAMLVLFAALFSWISAGFWTALAGMALLLKGEDRYRLSAEATPRDSSARTAIVMPICNENVTRVFAGLRATYESLERTGHAASFDFYVLSDSNDAASLFKEQQAWMDMCHAVNGFGRVFYRWRRLHIKRKSGNIADFCRRWGSRYRYMVILDADSVMSGDCLVRLAALMEAHPDAGIIQTAPRAAGRDTLHARVQQFSTSVYGPMFTAGLHFWQLGEAHYWGHNAIIRMAPFMRHCALARLPGRGPLAGEILSHDFVEAALMRRAGWTVWIAHDLRGSYEETPPNLVDELTRDRRWCQGNLMNFRLLFMEGLRSAHRLVFVTGVMAYLSAALWFVMLILATTLLAVHTLQAPQYFVEPYQLFPLWPQWHPDRAIALFSTTATLLFLPKVAAVLLAEFREAAAHGGRLRLAASALLELILSMLLAPIRMLFHTQFVLAPLMGRTVRWKSPPREDIETGLDEALRRHGWHTLLGIAWTGFVYWLNPMFLWWLLPVVGALILSIPLSMYSSRVELGRRLRAAGLFMTPEESAPPPEIARVRELLEPSARTAGAEREPAPVPARTLALRRSVASP